MYVTANWLCNFILYLIDSQYLAVVCTYPWGLREQNSFCMLLRIWKYCPTGTLNTSHNECVVSGLIAFMLRCRCCMSHIFHTFSAPCLLHVVRYWELTVLESWTFSNNTTRTHHQNAADVAIQPDCLSGPNKSANVQSSMISTNWTCNRGIFPGWMLKGHRSTRHIYVQLVMPVCNSHYMFMNLSFDSRHHATSMTDCPCKHFVPGDFWSLQQIQRYQILSLIKTCQNKSTQSAVKYASKQSDCTLL